MTVGRRQRAEQILIRMKKAVSEVSVQPFFVCGGESYSNVPEANSHTISFGTDELSLLSN
jgi:hypothetical protein